MKKCIRCGHMISDSAFFCSECGTPQIVNEAAESNLAAPDNDNRHDGHKRKLIIIAGAVIAALIAAILFYKAHSTAQGEENTQNQVSETAETEETSVEVLDETSQINTASDWIYAEMANGGITSEEDVKNLLNRISKQAFIKAWKKTALTYMGDISIDDDENHYADVLNRFISIYSAVMGGTADIQTAVNIANRIEENNSMIRDAVSQMPYISGGIPNSGEFYVIKRLRYADNSVGQFIAEAQEGSEWLCSDVEYIFGSACPGDNDYVLYSENNDPFTKSGAYWVTYVDTGKTEKLTNGSGFNYEAPIYEIIDGDKYFENQVVCDARADDNRAAEGELMRFLGGEQAASDNSYAEGGGNDAQSYMISGSDSRYLDRAELTGLSEYDLRIARNEIYARHGRIFKDPTLSSYFNAKAWYYPTIQPDDFNEDSLSAIEKANVNLIKEVEATR